VIVSGGQGRGTTCRLHPDCTRPLSAFCIEAQLSKHWCTTQPSTSKTSNVGSTRESATSRFHLLPSFYISCTAIESTYIQAATYSALRVNQYTGSGRAVHHSQTVGTYALDRGRGPRAATAAG
jgi:hypothetical protein